MCGGNWWDILPREVYSTLERVETGHPWYSVYRIHDWLYAILEDGQFDEALMYLVIGEEGAVLIDGGTGIGRLDLLVAELTEKPVLLLLTHTHNDHIGGCKDFDEIALFDDAMSRESAAEGLGKEKMGEMLAVAPELVEMDRARGVVPDLPLHVQVKWNFDELTPYGVTGDPTKATEGKGRLMRDALVELLVEFVGEMDERGWDFKFYKL